MFRKLLEPDNWLNILMTRITDCIFLSLFFLLGCLPVVTVGTSLAALYDSAYRGLRRGDRHSWTRFWQVYRENWKSGLLPGVLLLAMIYALARGMVALWNAAVAGQVGWMLFSAAALLAAVVLGCISVMMPMLSRFENSLSALLKNTLLLSLANLPRTLALGLLNALAGIACLNWAVPVFVLPALAAMLGSFLVEPMFRPYMPEETELEPEEAAEEFEEPEE